MKEFVPVTDELLYEHPELVVGRLIPFSLDFPCHRWMEAVETDNKGVDDEQ